MRWPPPRPRASQRGGGGKEHESSGGFTGEFYAVSSNPLARAKTRPDSSTRASSIVLNVPFQSSCGVGQPSFDFGPNWRCDQPGWTDGRATQQSLRSPATWSRSPLAKRVPALSVAQVLAQSTHPG